MKKIRQKVTVYLMLGILIGLPCVQLATASPLEKTTHRSHDSSEQAPFFMMGIGVAKVYVAPSHIPTFEFKTIHPIYAIRIGGSSLGRHVIGPLNIWYIFMSKYTFSGTIIPLGLFPLRGDGDQYSPCFIRGTFTPR